ncbi:MAG: T9SS type A sorting domain-containing protein [Ferruginibacter sp.]
MRKTNSYQSAFIKIAFIVFCALLVLVYNSTRAASGRMFSKTHIIFRQMPNSDISMKVKASEAVQLQFYLFTSEGKLLKKIETAGSAISVIKNPGSGIYLYQCFENDHELKSGKLILKNNKLNYD